MVWGTPLTFVAGTKHTAAALNAGIRDLFKAIGDPWSTYACTWSAAGGSPAIGSGGSVVGYSMQAGKTTLYRIVHTFGGAGLNVGTGAYSWTLPANAVAVRIGTGQVVSFDTSAGTVDVGHAYATGVGTVGALINAGTRVTATSPYAWANGDTIIITGSYEAA